MKINKQCLVVIHVLSCFIYLPEHCHFLHLMLNYQFDIHITFRYFPQGRKNLKKRRFILKKHQMFSLHTPLEEFKTQQSPVIQAGNLWLRKIRTGKPLIISTSLFSKSYVLKMFAVYTQSRPFFQIPLVWRASHSFAAISSRTLEEKFHIMSALVLFTIHDLRKR